MLGVGFGPNAKGVLMKFVVTFIVVALVVVAVLHFTGWDLLGRINGSGPHDVVTSARDFSPTHNPHFMNNLIAGIVSGLIVAIITGMFSRR